MERKCICTIGAQASSCRGNNLCANEWWKRTQISYNFSKCAQIRTAHKMYTFFAHGVHFLIFYCTFFYLSIFSGGPCNRDCLASPMWVFGTVGFKFMGCLCKHVRYGRMEFLHTVVLSRWPGLNRRPCVSTTNATTVPFMSTICFRAR